jgi:ubiquinone/menaquinone biosynthesis C-methylase UbiE
MRLIDCVCGPGSITVDLAQGVESGETIGIDVREEALVQGRMLARQRGVSKVEFLVPSIYQLPLLTAQSTQHSRLRFCST